LTHQHYHEEGYGVATYDSAYVLIERNLFDYNRHAIASSGDAGTGYYAHSNLVLWNGGTAIKVRGEPSIGAFVDNNVFKHPQQWGGYLDDAALVQTTGHKDGTLDTFVATDQTWWYWYWSEASGGGRYTYPNTSTKGLPQLTVGDLNGDGVCDVKDDGGVVYLGGSIPVPTPSTERWSTCPSGAGRPHPVSRRGLVV